jgi:hypothetical protein
VGGDGWVARVEQRAEPVLPGEVGRGRGDGVEDAFDDVPGEEVLAADVVVDDRGRDLQAAGEVADRPAGQVRFAGEFERDVDDPVRGEAYMEWRVRHVDLPFSITGQCG